MNELALFAGAGGGILGGILSGWRTVCAVERDRFARSVLLARQNDRMLEPFPVWDDVTTFDAKPWRGIIEVVSGGFPCQDISVARAMWGRKGLEGERSGLWKQNLRIISEVRPPHVFGENSPALRTCGLDKIIEGLAEIGYASRWIILGADSVGLHHKRDRLWFYASDTNSPRLERYFGNGGGSQGWEDEIRQASDASFRVCSFCGFVFDDAQGAYGCENCEGEGLSGNNDSREGLLPRVAGMGHGVADWLDRIKAVGNGQVPAVAALAWEILRLNTPNLSQDTAAS
jgi:DNA (cytosine-5)-methyltransferase 1